MPPLNSSGQAPADSSADVPESSGVSSSGSSDTIAGVDLASVLADLNENHVAGVDSTADLSKIASMVADARGQGLELWVVSIGRKINDTDTSAISAALFAKTGGTLLVLSPSLVSARSDQLTDDQEDQAKKAAAGASSDETAVSDFIDAALRSAGVTTSKTTPTTTKTSPTKHQTVGGVDVDTVVGSLGSDHIAIGKGVTGVTDKQLSVPVQKAWKQGLKLYVAILSKDATGHLYDVATAVMKQTGGTVIMVSPSLYAISSTTIDNDTLQSALDAGANATNYVDLIDDMVDVLLG
jgi:hypothetical protein